MSAVPVIDVSALRAGSLDERRRVGAEIAAACEEIGFFQITGHGVDEELDAATYRAARDFFDLPAERKAEVSQPSTDVVRGWSAVGAEGLAASMDAEAPGDLKEKFDIGMPDVPDDPYFGPELAGTHFAPNLWPSALPEMRPLFERYFAEMAELSRLLMRAFALGLDLDEDFFESKIDRHISMFRAINYPDQPTEPLPGQLRAGVHTDYGSLTIVRQEEAPGGLQVRDKTGAWVDVPVVPGGLVINIGDLMAEWTNDRWVSTLHRVVNPPREVAADSRRLSLIFFHQPNYDAVIECLPGCLAPGQTPRHEPVTSGAHLLGKFVKQVTYAS
ncbi:isopenicillin N synthase family dioxygenase [Trujillonella humicola]|uniref:isopenicillin N synthase family dioxygenase n=1 Tax=Trujillonella humicola TaxID=3383699 RepID=UPI0039060F87